MKPETAEWIGKAEGDWKVAQREMQALDPMWNVVCFLAEQCAEKYLKGCLEEHNIAFRKIHDLVVLLNTSRSSPRIRTTEAAASPPQHFWYRRALSRGSCGPTGC